jgi:ubiquinone/menaquinone biosynthesis C-methylase UbiE
MRDSNTEWERWGEIDPLYGVAAAKGRERGGKNPWSDAEFYERGQQHWQRFHPAWRRYGIDCRNCLEIGCGAGRITAQLAGVFAMVEAVDVSKGMIDYAVAHVTAPNVRFHLTDGTALPLESASITAVFSTHVFQHFDSIDQATLTFREIARVLAPGGSIMIHLPMYRWPVFHRAPMNSSTVYTRTWAPSAHGYCVLSSRAEWCVR